MCTKNILYNLGSHTNGDEFILLLFNDCIFLAYEGGYLGRKRLPLNTKTRLCYTDCLILLWAHFSLYLICLPFYCCRDNFQKNVIFMAYHLVTRKTLGGFERNFIFQVLIKGAEAQALFFFFLREAIPFCIIKFV